MVKNLLVELGLTGVGFAWGVGVGVEVVDFWGWDIFIIVVAFLIKSFN